jgi:hypothetical protein
MKSGQAFDPAFQRQIAAQLRMSRHADLRRAGKAFGVFDAKRADITAFKSLTSKVSAACAAHGVKVPRAG